MRQVRNFDRHDLWFGIVLAVFFIPAAIMFLGGALTDIGFLLRLLPFVALIVAVSFLRPLLDRLGRAPRFLAWFCIFAAGAAFLEWSRGRALNLVAIAAGGLIVATIDLLTEHFRSKREAAGG
jgi:hypothetical protein